MCVALVALSKPKRFIALNYFICGKRLNLKPEKKIIALGNA